MEVFTCLPSLQNRNYFRLAPLWKSFSGIPANFKTAAGPPCWRWAGSPPRAALLPRGKFGARISSLHDSNTIPVKPTGFLARWWSEAFIVCFFRGASTLLFKKDCGHRHAGAPAIPDPRFRRLPPALGAGANRPTILVVGGSSVRAVLNLYLSALKLVPAAQLLHLSGKVFEVQAGFTRRRASRRW